MNIDKIFFIAFFMRTAKFLLIALFLFTFSFITPVAAVAVNPADYSPVADETVVFMLTAELPEPGVIAVQLRLQVEDGVILDYTPPTDIEGIPAIPTCSNGAYFSETEVCADFSTPTTIADGQDLGTVTVKFTSTTGSLYKTEDNAYLNSELVYIRDNGTLVGTMEPTVTLTTTPAETTTDNANALNTVMAVLLITIGLVLISVAIVLVAKHTKSKHETHSNN